MNRSEKKDENGCCATPFSGRMPAAGVATAAVTEKKGRRRKERKKKGIRPDLGFSKSC